MKCAFQLVKQSDGTRSDVMVFERTEFANELMERFTVDYLHDVDNYYVLVLCEFPTRGTDNPEWDFSIAPLMTVRRFVEVFGNGTPFPEQPASSVSMDTDMDAGEVPAGDNRVNGRL